MYLSEKKKNNENTFDRMIYNYLPIFLNAIRQLLSKNIKEFLVQF